MNAQTPGPWIVETAYGGKYPEFSVIAPQGWQEESGEYKRCSVATGLDSKDDAYLMAAAPELLEQLRKAMKSLMPYGHSHRSTASPTMQAGLCWASCREQPLSPRPKGA